MQPVNRYCRPPAHPTKWTVVVDRPREARALTLFDTQAEVHAEIIRLRERGVAHVFALAPLAACGDRPTVAALRDPTDMGENEAVGPVLRAPDGGMGIPSAERRLATSDGLPF